MRPKSEQIVLLLWMHRYLSNLKIKRQEKIKHEDFQILITMRGYRNFACKNKRVGGGKLKSVVYFVYFWLHFSWSLRTASLFILHTFTIL